MKAALRKLLDKIEFHPSMESVEVYDLANQALTLAMETNSLEGEVMAKWTIAIYHISKGGYSEAEFLLKEALMLTNDTRKKKYRGRILSSLGGIYFKDNELGRSLKFLFDALNYVDDFWGVSTYNTIGVIYRKQGDFQLSEKYFQKAINSGRSRGNYTALISTLVNYARNKVLQENYTEALKIYEEAIALSKQHNFKRGHVYGLNHQVEVYHRLGDNERAIALCRELIDLCKKDDYQYELVRGLEILGILLNKQGDHVKAFDYLEEALNLSEQNNYTNLTLDILAKLAECYEEHGQIDKAYRCTLRSNELYQQELAEKDRSKIRTLLQDREEQIMLLEKQKEKIIKQNRELRQYAYIVAHDLREPLRNISGFASLFDRRYASHINGEGKEYLEFIKSGAQHMYRQLEDLLTYATLDEMPKQSDMVDLNKLVLGIKEQLKEMIQSSGAVIHCADLPMLKGSPLHFEQLFQNIIHNAIKFRTADLSPVVHIEFEDRSDDYLFRITDNGIGISPRYHQAIFKIFKRLDRKNYSGTGIGLAICEKVIELYEGQIWLESEEGKGVTFIFTIPKIND